MINEKLFNLTVYRADLFNNCFSPKKQIKFLFNNHIDVSMNPTYFTIFKTKINKTLYKINIVFTNIK